MRVRRAVLAAFSGAWLTLACGCGCAGPADAARLLEWNEQAMLCEERGDWLCADEAYTRMLALRTDDPLLVQRRARVRGLRNDRTGAQRDAGRLLELLPDSAAARWTLAEYSADPEDKLRGLDVAVRLSAGAAPALLYRGLERARRQDLIGADADFAAAYRAWPAYTPILLYRGLAARERGDPQAALQFFTAAVHADLERERRQAAPLFVLRSGGAFQAYYERGRLQIEAGRRAAGCRDLLDAVRRGYLGAPFGCRILLEDLTVRARQSL